MSVVERLSAHGRVRYGRFHCIVQLHSAFEMESGNEKTHHFPKNTHNWYKYLSVTEEEHNGSVVDAILEEAALHILPPLSSTVFLGELDLETVILCPVKEGWDNNTVDDFCKKKGYMCLYFVM